MDPKTLLGELGERLVDRTRVLLTQYPSRLTGGPGERGLQDACVSELEGLGGTVEWQSFRWGKSIYQSLALHFGLATAALALSFWAPLVAAGLHVLVAVSYTSESMYKRPILRQMLPSARSQNAIVTFPSRRPLAHRIVTLAHADAAYTGVLFNPSMVRLAAKEATNPIARAFRKGLALATFSLFAIAALEIGMYLVPGSRLWAIAAFALSVPSLAAFILNLDVVVRNQVVPAANDNLSGCVATLELAQRFAKTLPDDIELVTVITGCEEAGAGGATNLMRMVVADGRWSTTNTTVLALDTFSGGEPRLLQEGELFVKAIPPRLEALANQVCAADPSVGTGHAVRDSVGRDRRVALPRRRLRVARGHVHRSIAGRAAQLPPAERHRRQPRRARVRTHLPVHRAAHRGARRGAEQDLPRPRARAQAEARGLPGARGPAREPVTRARR